MIVRFVMKDAHVPASIQETMNKRCHQRMDAYLKDEAPDATVITVRVTEQKSTFKVEMTMPYLGHTLRTENQEREISLPALDKGIDILERQMKKLRTRLGRDLRKKPAVAEEAPAPVEEEAIEEQEKVIRVKRYAELTLEDCPEGEYIVDELMQAARRRFYRPEYIACPGCGRTMYNLESTFEEVKKRTAHLKGMIIAVMGCIVNGPGEMADADWGYVGEGNGKVSIYKGKTPVLRHVPETEAIDRLLELIENS